MQHVPLVLIEKFHKFTFYFEILSPDEQISHGAGPKNPMQRRRVSPPHLEYLNAWNIPMHVIDDVSPSRRRQRIRIYSDLL